MNHRRLLAVLTAAAIVTAFSGCGRAKKMPQEEPETSSAVSEAAPSEEEKESLSEAPPQPDPETLPEGVAGLAFDAFKALDVERMERYIAGMDKVSALMNDDTRKSAAFITRDLSCAIGDVRVEGDKAYVKARITNHDFSGVVASLLPTLLFWTAQNPQATQAEIVTFFSEKLADSLEGAGGDPVTKEVEVELLRDGDSWKLNLDAQTADALFGGMLGSMGALTEQFGLPGISAQQ